MDFKEELITVITEWRKDPIEDEWVFENFRTRCAEQMTSEEAFAVISQVVPMLLLEEDESTSIELLQTVLQLVRQSNTTELPNAFVASTGKLRSQFDTYGEYAQKKLSELFDYYRI